MNTQDDPKLTNNDEQNKLMILTDFNNELFL